MKDRIYGTLQRVGQSFVMPIAVLPIAGFLLAVSSGLREFVEDGTVLYTLIQTMNQAGKAIFSNVALLFAIGVAIGMAKRAKEVAGFSAALAYIVMHTTIHTMLVMNGQITENGEWMQGLAEGTYTTVLGISTLELGVFGGLIVGLGVGALHNRFNKIMLPDVISFFGGTRFVPIISSVVYLAVGILLFFLWPPIQRAVYILGTMMTDSGYAGTFVFGVLKRVLMPFGLHHLFYLPFWQTALGGTMEVAGSVVEGGQNIFFAQLADSAHVTHYSVEATRYFSGEFIFMMFGLPGAALAMYHCAKKEKKKKAGKLLLSASLGSMMMGITEPLEFSFLFVSPYLFAIQVVLAGSAYMVAHMCDIAVGVTFSGGFFDLFLYGILQGNEKTSWMLIIPVGLIYFALYYVIFRLVILKFNLKTPGREDEEETKLYTKMDVYEKKKGIKESETSEEEKPMDVISEAITNGLGGKKNISELDCCATRLRCSVHRPELVNSKLLKSAGATGVVQHGNAVQVVFGPRVTIIKSNLEDYLDQAPNVEFVIKEKEQEEAEYSEQENEQNQSDAKDLSDFMETQWNGDENETIEGGKKLISTVTIFSPFTGIAADLSAAPDETFSQRMVGDGAVVTPTDSLLCAPTDGTISFVFETKHALVFSTDSGINLMIHVGIDTVQLNGEGFEVLAERGTVVKKGDPILKVDLEVIRPKVPSLMTPIICPELTENQRVRLLHEGEIQAGEPLFAIDTVEK
ncbi:MAG: glucose PTS transporter subunit IIA [Lachnospiraceae bacterium]